MISRVCFILLSALLTGCGAASTGLAKNTCIKGWIQYDTRCFKFVSMRKTWAESERYCLMMGGNLASVHSANEYYFIQEVVRSETKGTNSTWIGGYDATQEGLWLWSDGSRFDYTHWNSGEPSNHQGSEHCLRFNWGASLGWNDCPCHILQPSVCAMPL